MANIDITNPGSNDANLQAAFRKLSLPRPFHYVTAIGDSRTAAIWSDTPTAGYGGRRSNYSPLNWARVLSGNRFVLGPSWGVSQKRTDEFISGGQLTNALASGCGTLMLWGGLNDIAQGYTALSAFNNLKTIAETCIANGMQVVVDQEVGANNLSAAQVTAVIELRQRLQEWAYKTPRLYLHDALPVVMQPGYSDTLLQFNPNYTYDGVHYNARGAFSHGKSLASVFQSIIPPRISNHFNRCENSTNNSANLLTPNPSLQGTAGTANTGITGSVPTGHSASRTGSATATTTITTNADGTRQIAFACNFTARGEVIRMNVDATNTNWDTGTIFEGFGELEVQNPVNVAGAQLYMSNNVNSGTVEMGDMIVPDTSTDAAAYGPLEGFAMKMNTKVYTVPVVTAKGWVSIQAAIVASGAGSATFIVKNLGIRKRLAA